MLTRNRFLAFIVVSLFILVLWIPPSEAFLPFLSGSQPPSDQSSQIQKKVDGYNQKAVELFEQGRFEEAQELWEKALTILENRATDSQDRHEISADADLVDETPILTGGEEDFDTNNVDKLYDAAVSLFKQEKYVASKKMFERIEAIIPDYKASRNYLSILEHKIRQAQQKLSGKSFEKNAIARQEERAEWERILEESRMELEKKLAQQAEPIYQEAVGYYKSRDFKLAKDYFSEVDGILPAYKDTKRYLSRIDKDIRDEETLLIEERRKRKILARKKEQEEWQRILQESERELKKKLIEQVDPIYQDAILYYKKRKFELAKGRFEEAQQIVPNYKSTEKYLDRIDHDIKEEARIRQEERARELERQKREAELARKREEERLAQLQKAREEEQLEQFKAEVAARRREREEWLRVLEETEKEKQRKLEEQARFVYREAIKYYRKREFEQAKEDFLEVQGIFPGYKSTEKYLARIDQDIEEERKVRYEQRQRAFQRKMQEKRMLEEQKKETEQEQRIVDERKRLEEFKKKALARKKQREEWERLIQENERERQERLKEEAEFIYQEAMRSYNVKRWEQAKLDFTEVEQILPGYKATRKYLAKVDDNIREEEKERRRIKRQTAQQRKQEEILARKEEEKRQTELRRAAEKKDIQRKEIQAQAVYQYAMSLYKRGDYEEAKESFLEVDQILSGYKSTEKYLKHIDRKIEEAEEIRQKEQRLAFERQIREQRLAQQREEERMARLRANEEERQILKFREEALLREQERKKWEQTIQEIEKEHQKRLKQQANSVYEEALRYYKAGWLEQAKETFEEVEVMWPGFKSGEKYLTLIDAEMRKAQRLRRESEEDILERQQWQAELAQQKKKAQQQQARKVEEQERIEKLKKEVAARQKQKEGLKESIDKMEREHRRDLQRKAKSLYRKAVKYYKAREFEQAKIAFIDVEKTWPDYKATAKYLARLDDDIRNERLADESTVPELKKHTVASDVSVLEPNGNKFVETASRERQEAFSQEAEEKYQEALALYKAKEFINAKLKFIEVESLFPGYKATLDYLGRIDKDISKNQKVRMAPEKKDVQEAKPEPKEEKHLAKVQTPSAAARPRHEIIQQALLDAERRVQEVSSAEAIKPLSHQERKLEREQPVDWQEYVQQRRAELKEQRREVRREYEKQFKEIYARAVKLYRSGAYEEAKALFLQIEEMKPGYKRAASYLKKAEAKIRKGLQKKQNHNVVLQPQNKTRRNIVEETLNELEQKL